MESPEVSFSTPLLTKNLMVLGFLGIQASSNHVSSSVKLNVFLSLLGSSLCKVVQGL